jgi:L-ascorbate metabolism protein UlaG (beta-lactamase superfamily)
LDINWLGHSCFRIKGKEAVLITDPCNPQTGYSIGKVKADIVTLSHNHPGHSYLDTLEDGYKLIKSPGEYELKSVFITGIATFHDKVDGQERGNNCVYVIEMDGITICHLGDIGHLLSSKTVEDIGNVGILLMPVGGLSTIDSSVAAEMVRTISPRIVIPMHYKTAAVTRDLEPVDKFLKKLGIMESVPQPKLVINKSTFTESTQVIVLGYPGQ